MTLTRKTRWALALGSGALLAAGIATHSVLQQARETAQAYLFGYPLVIMELTKQHQKLLGTTAINGFRHSRRFPDASFNSVVSPNVDTLYSIVHFDLRRDLPGIALHQGVNAEARYRPTTTVEKDVLLRGPTMSTLA